MGGGEDCQIWQNGSTIACLTRNNTNLGLNKLYSKHAGLPLVWAPCGVITGIQLSVNCDLTLPEEVHQCLSESNLNV